jgi:hypothetical protein
MPQLMPAQTNARCSKQPLLAGKKDDPGSCARRAGGLHCTTPRRRAQAAFASPGLLSGIPSLDVQPALHACMQPAGATALGYSTAAAFTPPLFFFMGGAYNNSTGPHERPSERGSKCDLQTS